MRAQLAGLLHVCLHSFNFAIAFHECNKVIFKEGGIKALFSAMQVATKVLTIVDAAIALISVLKGSHTYYIRTSKEHALAHKKYGNNTEFH